MYAPGQYATGAYSVALGTQSTATKTNSIAIGTECKATGEQTVAIGNGASAQSKNGIAIGHGVYAGTENQIALGQYNANTTDLFVIGNGEGSGISPRSNAHTLSKSGIAWFKGDVYTGGTS